MVCRPAKPSSPNWLSTRSKTDKIGRDCVCVLRAVVVYMTPKPTSRHHNGVMHQVTGTDCTLETFISRAISQLYLSNEKPKPSELFSELTMVHQRKLSNSEMFLRTQQTSTQRSMAQQTSIGQLMVWCEFSVLRTGVKLYRACGKKMKQGRQRRNRDRDRETTPSHSSLGFPEI